MPFNGAGVYTPPGADFPVVTNTVISSTHFNNTINDIATALSLCITKDGQQAVTANIPFNGFRVTNVGVTAINGSVGTPAINVGDVGTGLYRSALNELAVTVNGAQVGKFNSAGLTITGAASVSTTLTATTSVVTPLVAAGAGSNLSLDANGGSGSWLISSVNSAFRPLVAQDNLLNLGDPAARIKQVFTPIIDSGSTGSLLLRTNNGQTGLQVANVAGTVVNNWQAAGSTTGTSIVLQAVGTDTDIPLIISSKGAGAINFFSDAASSNQFQILRTASATRNITITGSNGGNPTIGTTAGNLAITPATVFASTITPTALVLGSPASITGEIRMANTTGLRYRDNANVNDFVLLDNAVVNSVFDVVRLSPSLLSPGVVFHGRSGAGAPSTSDVATSMCAVWKDTSGGSVKLFYNDSNTLKSVTLV